MAGQYPPQARRGVFAAYGWPPTLGDDDLLAKLLELKLARAGTAAPAADAEGDE